MGKQNGFYCNHPQKSCWSFVDNAQITQTEQVQEFFIQ